MSSTVKTSSARIDSAPTAARFQQLFAHEPSPQELARFRSAHQALALRVPARVRRAAGRVITRL